MKTQPELVTPAVFGPRVLAAFTTRRGGVSTPPYDSLNLGLATDDPAANISRNRAIVTQALGFAPDRIAFAGQVHGTIARRVEEPGLYERTDGLVTTEPGLALAITAADCAVVLLADEEAGVVAACHAGWRGAIGGIVPGALVLMSQAGASAARTSAYISPCISVDHFEVGEEVASKFPESVIVRSADRPRPHVDLKRYLLEVLTASGVQHDRIELDPGCTVSEGERFYSHRAERGVTGRMMGLIAIREEI